jgi:RNA polymerase sigma factor (sigma-70 family)
VKGSPLTDRNKNERFNQVALPHLDAAYNLAKWLTRNTQDAEDIVQESYMKAFRHFDTFRGDNGRAWLLAIVRNTSYTRLQMDKSFHIESYDESIHHSELRSQLSESSPLSGNPEQLALQEGDRKLIDEALQALPIQFREVLVLRELEDFSYHEIANIVGIPMGTVMSRLSRARELMRQQLNQHFKPESRL